MNGMTNNYNPRIIKCFKKKYINIKILMMIENFSEKKTLN